MANHCYDSEGNVYTTPQVDRRVHAAKFEKLEQMRDDYGYVFCEEPECGKNASAGEPIDCSHDESVYKSKQERRVELAWDVNNITMRCRTCHRIHDGTYLGNGN